MIRCLFCDYEIESRRETWAEMIGFARPSHTTKGGSSLVLRNPTGRVACHSCIIAVQHGVKVGEQERLFDDVG